MRASEFLEVRGAEILRKINDFRPQFLIEIDLGDSELAEFLAHISDYQYFASRATARASLALAAVHMANRAEAGDTSYIDLFFRRLRLLPSSAWQGVYGPAIARFLHDTFGEPERHGPYRFVGPIYRHAGVPRHALGTFSRLLEALLRDYGPAFTRYEYDSACGGLAAGLVSDFLESDAGYEFARDAARVLLRIRDNDVQDLETVPGFPKGFWPDLLERVTPQMVVKTTRQPSLNPQLALDAENWHLGVRIPTAALRLGVRRDGRRLTTEWDALRTGREVYHVGDLEWRLPWSPQERGRGRALFRVTDGTFVAAVGDGTVPPGTYYLVSPAEDRPSPSIVIEDCGYLDWDADPLLLAWRVHLSPGYVEPSWDLTVAGDALPALAFETGRQDPAFAASTYLGHLPDLIVENWNAESERMFLLRIDCGQGAQSLNVPATGGRAPLNVPCPAQGMIWLEPKGRLRFPSERLPRLPFTVIPSAVRICGTASPARDDKCSEVRASLPPAWTLKWDPELVGCAPGAWIVPGGVSVLDGELTDGRITVHISWRVPRWSVRLRTPHGAGQVLWYQDLESDAAVTIRAPEGVRAVLTLRSSGGEVLLWELGRMPASSACTIRALAFRDFLRASTLPTAEIGLRLGTNPAEPTGIYWIGSVEKVLDAAADPTCQRVLEEIPQAGPCLCTLSRMRLERQTTCDLSFGSVTTPVQRLVANCAVLAEVLDGTSVRPAGVLSEFASSEIGALLEWVRSAQVVLSGQGNVEACLSSFPGCPESVPFPRWRESIGWLHDEVAAQADVPRMVSEWRTEVRSGVFGIPSSRIARMAGGWELTQGAVKYRRAMQVTSDERRVWLQAAAKHLREAAESAAPVVAGLAKALWLMTIYRLGYPPDPHQEWRPPVWLRPTDATLCRLGVLLRHDEDVAWPDGLGYAEISPAEDDGELERSLGRVTRGH